MGYYNKLKMIVNQENHYEEMRKQTNYGACSLHQVIRLNHNQQPYNQVIQLPNMKFTPYRSDEVSDNGWGCAWRSIQMVLSSFFDTTPDFAWLFSFFGQKIILQQIYMHMRALKEVPPYLQQAKFAPHDLHSGWAEPFIGQLILQYFGFTAQLFLVNGYPPSANAPKEVFESVKSFDEFRLYLIKHFKELNTPIQIDDATYSMVIYGAQLHNDSLVLSIGDPHIRQNCTDQEIGLYTVTLNALGDQVSHSIKQDQEQLYMYQNSYRQLHFKGKQWMAMAVTGQGAVWKEWKDRQLIVDK